MDPRTTDSKRSPSRSAAGFLKELTGKLSSIDKMAKFGGKRVVNMDRHLTMPESNCNPKPMGHENLVQ